MFKEMLAAPALVKYNENLIKVTDSNDAYSIELLFDAADLVLISKLHIGANPNQSESSDDIDKLIDIAKAFHLIHKKTDWEEYKTDWVSTIFDFYNRWALKEQWNITKPFDENAEIKEKMSHFLVNEWDELDGLILAIIAKAKVSDNDMIDWVDYLTVTENLEWSMSVKTFCGLVGIKY